LSGAPLVVVDPLGLVPTFVAITHGLPKSRIGEALKSHMTRRKAAAKTSRGKAVNKKAR
jgi:small neutral amino acid transporter SnatA (MarC family)